MRKITLLLLLLSVLKMAHAQTAEELVQVTDMLKIKTVDNITTTKDGTKAAFTLTSVEPDDTSKLDYKYLTQIYILSTTGNATPIQVTRAKEGATQPAWSPDGQQLAFVRRVEGKPQVFVLSMHGGEPLQLTAYKYGASKPKWSPDGKQILFSAGISLPELLEDTVLNVSRAYPSWPFEKPGFDQNQQFKANESKGDPNGNLAEIKAYLDNNDMDQKSIVLNKLNFQNETAISAEMKFNQFFLIDAVQGAEPRAITKGFYRYNNADFTPNGQQIVVTADVDSLENPDRSLESEILIADKNGANLRVLLGEKGKVYNSAVVSPSGKWLAFQYSNTAYVGIPTLAIMPLNGSAKDIITIPYDRNKSNLTWSKDEKYLYFTAPSNGGVVLCRANRASQKVEELSGHDKGITSFDLAGNKIIYSQTQVANPSELYSSNASFKNEKQLSTFNDWVNTKKLSYPEKKTFTNSLGLQVEYWVMKPANYQPGQKYPLLLEMHGGPTAMWGPGESSMWHEFQYFCSQGYGVVYANPRGSGGYGEEFLRANIKDWGAGPASDVLTALDNTVAEGWADTSNLFITGGSYAGYLAAWIISHDNRFRAACSQRGVYDLSTFFGEGNAWRLVPNYFGGYPWEPEVKEILVRESPITYVHNITTPFIIFHGGSDRRTGFVQGEMMYRSLKVLGRPVEYVIHPGASHEITRSGDNRQRMDQMLRTYEFFERWMNRN
jgi:dipeptidyl aminopeptidase/acylaminoacyl peptidase